MLQTIERVQALIRSGELTKAGLAQDAGLHANSLRRADQADWNPTADTLRRLEEFLDKRAEETFCLSPIPEILEEARNGRMFILVDNEDRENEGDLVIPAQMATPEVINFMARFGRGLICLAMDRKRVEALGLGLMSRQNGTRHQTAFTVSIEAAEGVTTGISAADRARTIQVAIDSSKGAADIVTPGHVFPLVARDGGVLVRAGHTEAAVDVSRLAGLNSAGVICEIMNDDGTMARMPDLIRFAQRHQLKIATIADLIAYRLKNDSLVKAVADARFEAPTSGLWTAKAYINTAEYAEHLVLVKGHPVPEEPTLVRVHTLNIFDDFLGEVGARSGQLRAAMELINDAGTGVVVVIRDTRQTALSDLMRRRAEPGVASIPEALRDYGIGAQILIDLGVRQMVLLTNSSPHNVVGLEAFGLKIVEERAIPL